MRHPLDFLPTNLRRPLFFLFLGLTVAGFAVFQLLDQPLRTPAALRELSRLSWPAGSCLKNNISLLSYLLQSADAQDISDPHFDSDSLFVPVGPSSHADNHPLALCHSHIDSHFYTASIGDGGYPYDCSYNCPDISFPNGAGECACCA